MFRTENLTGIVLLAWLVRFYWLLGGNSVLIFSAIKVGEPRESILTIYDLWIRRMII